MRDISDGAEPSSQDVQIIENILIQQKLPCSVLNVLLHYVLLKTNMNLNKNYIEKIAAHWARKKVGSAKDAMLLAKQENKKYKEINEVRKVRKVRNVSESSNTNVIDMPNGKALKLINLTRHVGFHSDDETIGYLLNEAYQQL
ncbi:DnaD domain protein [Lederbergia lenta]|uniref:Replication initiation and membrane attachment protein n=1 Tax=Lederbergia lenta TaxID=1467 RepID=A0A2X4W5W9_LEDLE|nr:DnaD domain protein [Lederbergia lenta]MEC2324517.1 DnaD domain protein [Lederbergia lenta]SQI59606.1 replication initiation and membrane attachment protein [Lederbergia lenta]